MSTPTHAALGFAIGAALGHPVIGIAASVIIDVDHLITYTRHGVLANPRLFWKTITSNEDPYGAQRGLLHSLLVSVPLSGLLITIYRPLAPVLIAAYASHLFLDMLDSADWWPFYPFKFLNVRGPVRFFSLQEFFLGVLFVTAGFIFL